MKPKEYLKQLEIEIEMGDNYDEIQASKHRLEGAKAIYMIMSRSWRNAEKSEKRKAQKKKYAEEHKAYFAEYQRKYQPKYRAKKKNAIDKKPNL